MTGLDGQMRSIGYRTLHQYPVAQALAKLSKPEMDEHKDSNERRARAAVGQVVRWGNEEAHHIGLGLIHCAFAGNSAIRGDN